MTKVPMKLGALACVGRIRGARVRTSTHCIFFERAHLRLGGELVLREVLGRFSSGSYMFKRPSYKQYMKIQGSNDKT